MRIRIAFIATVALVLALPGVASAAITVVNTNDSGPGSLRQAILEAPPGETIVLPAGTYTLTSGPLAVTKAVTIDGHGSADTIVRAGAAFGVFEVVGVFDATIDGITIRDGNLVGSSATGAGVLAVNANLTLRGVAVTNNVANANGAGPEGKGGLAEGGGVLTVTGTLTLIDSTVSGNIATAVGGNGKAGGLAEGAGILAVGPVTILNSTIANNLADARGGQGPSNAAQDGGTAEGAGLLAVQNNPGSSSIVGSTFSGNLADASGGPGGGPGTAEGGGILEVSNAASLSISTSTIAANVTRAQGVGGGGFIAGGGMLAIANNPGSIALLGLTLSGNRVEGTATTVNAGNLYAVGNPAQQFTIGDTIVANGVGPASSENCIPAPGLSVSLGFNLDSLDQCGFHSNGDQVNKDPQLGPLQANGGLTATMAPAASSPAIDQGASFGLLIDQRGVLRPIDLPSIPNSPAPGANGADVGAHELQPSNDLSLGKLKKNRKRGTATLKVNLPQPSAGVLTLSGKGLRSRTLTVTGQSSVNLKVATKGAAKKALRKRGKRKVKINVTYTPTGNTASTESRRTKLVRKKAKHGRRGQQKR